MTKTIALMIDFNPTCYYIKYKRRKHWVNRCYQIGYKNQDSNI